MSPLNFSYIPEISIIVPTYNRAKYLSNCIESVINQTFKDWELILIDDGSNDDTFDIINPFLQKHENIRYLKHKNRKMGFSRNAGIQASFGKYITFLDSDDQYKENHLESRLEYMKANPEVDFISGGFETEGERLVADYYQPGKYINLEECAVGGTFFVKRHVLFELKGFQDMPYAEDTDLWERAEKKFKTAKIYEPRTYLYTKSEDSVSKSFIANLSLS
jgi:glycosyltransferase involved in cell wall biosynthesis